MDHVVEIIIRYDIYLNNIANFIDFSTYIKCLIFDHQHLKHWVINRIDVIHLT